MQTQTPPAPLLTPEEVRRMLGLRTKTNHTIRAWERRGLLKPVRFNSRVLRYRREDVEALVALGHMAADRPDSQG
jgi:DNA-binding transcriptional MerR regulator